MPNIPLIATIDLGDDFPSQFKKNILKEINNKISSVLPVAVRHIKEKLGESVRVRIMSSPEYAAIAGGRFRGELGLPDGATRIHAIVERWAESISVTYRKGTGASLGSIEIGILQADWEDVLAMGEAVLNYSSI